MPLWFVKCYIASPYTVGDSAENVRAQMEAAHKLMDYCISPYTPLLSHFLHIYQPRNYDEWMAIDMSFLPMCDCLLRLPGDSAGADVQVCRAQSLKIPVFESVDAVVAHYDV
jgi:hypothetical protein